MPVELKLNRAQLTRFVATVDSLTEAVRVLEHTVGDLADRVLLVQPKQRPAKRANGAAPGAAEGGTNTVNIDNTSV
jgi:hypothetical protein